jgi:hypothetical protein
MVSTYNNPVVASYKDDVMLEGREADRKVKLRDCLLNNAEIMSWWEQAKTTEKYSLVMNNCATMVIRALKVGGASDFVFIVTVHSWRISI